MLYKNPIRLNLLPHREVLADARKKLFTTRAALVGVLACVFSLLVWQVIDRYISAQTERNNFLNTEIKKLDLEIAQIATLQQEIDGLKARQKSVEDLQADRNLPVYVFEELSSYVPEGVFLRGVRQDGQKLTLTGLAQTQERVSEMLRNFTNTSVWLENPELLEIKLVNSFAGIKTSEKLYEFTIAVLAKREKKKLTNNPNGVQNSAQNSGQNNVQGNGQALNPGANTLITPAAKQVIQTVPNTVGTTNMPQSISGAQKLIPAEALSSPVKK
jgi:type IV pilus assembly protein PilN